MIREYNKANFIIFIDKACKKSLFLLIFLLSFSSFTVFADSEDTVQNSLSEIDSLLLNFEREAAYIKMQELHPLLKNGSNKAAYMSNLANLVWMEKRYGKYDRMVTNAATLFQVAEKEKSIEFQIVALDALAFFDYFNYSNDEMAKKLDRMLTISANAGKADPISSYLIGAALLAIDAQTPDTAREYFYQAVNALPINKPITFKGLNSKILVLSDIASTYSKQDNYAEAIKVMDKIQSIINPKDTELVVEMHTQYANYYLKSKMYQKAEEHLESAIEGYENTSEDFKKALTPETLQSLEAAIAYSLGNYNKAAEIYQSLYFTEQSPEEVQETIEAQAAANKFKMSDINKQLDLMDSLKIAQEERILSQNRFLTMAYISIALMAFVIIGILIALSVFLKQKNRLYLLSITDQLTQLFNRRQIIDIYENIEPGAKCISLIDLDRFKQINDTYGHIVGDEVLRTVAATIKSSMRQQDYIGRYGGEEFLMILDTKDLSVAMEISERIRKQVEEIEWSHPGLKTSISVGLVYSQTHIGDFLLTEADSMLYRAKAEGRNRIVSLEI